MSLNWEMPKEFFENHKNLMWRDNEDDTSDVQPELQCLIFGTMLIQHDMDGEMTDEKLVEIHRRLTLLAGTDSLPTWTLWSDEIPKLKGIFRRPPNIETVIRYWGLETNVSHKKAKEWDKYFIKITQSRKSDVMYEVEEAKKKIASCPDKTQPERMLQEMKEEHLKSLETPSVPQI